jgi:hypothetical protein
MPWWIDMRRHVAGLTRGDGKTKAQGKWIVLRTMRVGAYSEHWNYRTKESIGGPKWLYDDVIIRAISRPGSLQAALPGLAQSANNIADTAGIEATDQMIYAIEVNEELIRYPLEGDRVYEIAEFNSKTKPTPPLTALSMFEVLNCIHETGDNGRSEVIYLHTQRKAGVS